MKDMFTISTLFQVYVEQKDKLLKLEAKKCFTGEYALVKRVVVRLEQFFLSRDQGVYRLEKGTELIGPLVAEIQESAAKTEKI